MAHASTTTTTTRLDLDGAGRTARREVWGVERVRAASPGAMWDRLAAVKARYDPTNLFRLDQNVSPAG